MKRVIRLTESDLVRIVKRVINEQTPGIETTEFAPSMAKELRVGSDDKQMVFKSGNNPVTWKVIPKPAVDTTKSDRPKLPGFLDLQIVAQGIGNTYGRVLIDCKNKTVKTSGGNFTDDYTNYSVYVQGNAEKRGKDVEMALRNIFRAPWPYAGVVAEVGDAYCSRV